jgi:hypothetical protein
MRHCLSAIATVLLVAATSFALAQGGPPTGNASDAGAQANPGQDTSGSDQSAGQPWEASGEDLKGPPQRFPANKTPE